MKMNMTWQFGMKYLIATLKDGDRDGWAEAQLVDLAERLDRHNGEDGTEVVPMPRHGDTVEPVKKTRGPKGKKACPFCGKFFHPSGLKTHMAYCADNPDASDWHEVRGIVR
jgi:hypothetical protein